MARYFNYYLQLQERCTYNTLLFRNQKPKVSLMPRSQNLPFFQNTKTIRVLTLILVVPDKSGRYGLTSEFTWVSQLIGLYEKTVI